MDRETNQTTEQQKLDCLQSKLKICINATTTKDESTFNSTFEEWLPAFTSTSDAQAKLLDLTIDGTSSIMSVYITTPKLKELRAWKAVECLTLTHATFSMSELASLLEHCESLTTLTIQGLALSTESPSRTFVHTLTTLTVLGAVEVSQLASLPMKDIKTIVLKTGIVDFRRAPLSDYEAVMANAGIIRLSPSSSFTSFTCDRDDATKTQDRSNRIVVDVPYNMGHLTAPLFETSLGEDVEEVNVDAGSFLANLEFFSRNGSSLIRTADRDELGDDVSDDDRRRTGTQKNKIRCVRVLPRDDMMVKQTISAVDVMEAWAELSNCSFGLDLSGWTPAVPKWCLPESVGLPDDNKQMYYRHVMKV